MKTILLSGILLAPNFNGFSQPIITTQPQSQTNVAGTDATFSVAATGAPPLNYQWQFYSSKAPTLLHEKYFKIRGVIGRRKTPWTGDTTNLSGPDQDKHRKT